MAVRVPVCVCLAALSYGCAGSIPPALTPAPPVACRTPTVQWFAPGDPRERARIDSWCAGVGGPAIDSATDTAHIDEAELTDVVFVSWNVHVGRGDIPAFVADLRAGLHTRGRRFRHYVLLLQEAVRTSGVPALGGTARGAARIAPRSTRQPADIVEISRMLGTSLIYVPSMRNGNSASEPAEDRGNAIVSSVPLSAPVAIELPGERQRRVAIVARAGSVSVAVIHLDALGSAQRLRVLWTPWLRDMQLRSMVALLPTGPLVVGADLNTWHGRDEMAARSLGAIFRDAPLSIDRQGLGLRVLDYMFFRSAPSHHATYRQVENRYGSDHQPLVGWME